VNQWSDWDEVDEMKQEADYKVIRSEGVIWARCRWSSKRSLCRL